MDWKNSRQLTLFKKSKPCLIFFSFTLIATVLSTTAVTEKPTLTVTSSQTAAQDSNSSVTNTSIQTTTLSIVTTARPPTTTPDTSYLEQCPDGLLCKKLGSVCIECRLNHYCVYGEKSVGNCTVKPNITCEGERTFTQEYHCRYGYQLDKALYHCDSLSQATTCTVKQAPLETYTAKCTVKDDVICLGNRTFHKKFPCNWTSGYKWSTALVLSVTLGGFGVDRFYLGLWREGIGKLFSFGGLGVWTILDVILIAVGYVGPYDGSLFIYPWD